MKYYLFCLLSMLLINASFGQSAEVSINVHPGIELLTIIQKLAGQYPPSTPSKYENEVLAYFSKYKNLAAVNGIKNFKGNIYTDITSLGFCFRDFPNFKLNIPDSSDWIKTGNTNWYAYYGKENVVKYLHDCKDFAIQTGFWKFYQQHENEYKKWGAPIEAGIEKDSLIEKLNNFYKTTSEIPHFYICLDPLNGWGAHAITNPETFSPYYKNTKAYTLGFLSRKADTAQYPIFAYGDYATNLVWHEGSHIYLQPLFEKYKAQIDSLSYLYNGNDEEMKRQRISTWTYCLNENIVRGIVIALFKKYKNQRAWKKQNAAEILNGFIYAEDISNFILQDYLDHNDYKNFDEYFTVLLQKLRGKYPMSFP